MSGFYTTPFTPIAEKSALVWSSDKPERKESFMDVARAIRACIYASMKVEPESCEVLPVGANKKVDDQVKSLIQFKNMTRSNVSTRLKSLQFFAL